MTGGVNSRWREQPFSEGKPGHRDIPPPENLGSRHFAHTAFRGGNLNRNRAWPVDIHNRVKGKEKAGVY